MAGKSADVAALEEEIAKTKKKIESAERAVAERPDSNRARSLQITLRNLRAELHNLEESLDAARAEGADEEEEDEGDAWIRDALDKNQKEIDDIDLKLRDAKDQVEVNNLTVSKRFLQMERNQLLIRLTHETAPAASDEDIETVRREVESKMRIIEAQNKQIEELKKELSAAKAQVWDPLRETESDETRITVTAGRLRSINGEARRLGAENYELKKQIGELKTEKDSLHRTIGDLTVHIRDVEAHARETEARAGKLAAELQEAERRMEEADRTIDGLKAALEDSRRHGGI